MSWLIKYISRDITQFFNSIRQTASNYRINVNGELKKPWKEGVVGVVIYLMAKLKQLLEGPYWEKPAKGKVTVHPRTGHEDPEGE
jgi:hypothetical protein